MSLFNPPPHPFAVCHGMVTHVFIKEENLAAVIRETVEHLVERVEDLMVASAVNSTTDQQSTECQPTPSSELLSSDVKAEVETLLQETAEKIDASISTMDDSSASSIKLLRSIVREATQRFGYGVSAWVRRIASVPDQKLGHKDGYGDGDTSQRTNIPMISGK